MTDSPIRRAGVPAATAAHVGGVVTAENLNGGLASAGSSSSGPTPTSRDSGFATIVTLAFGMLVVLIGMTVVTAGTATIARHQAQTAADFGALAGAARAELQPDAACIAAAQVVEANGATMQGCQLSGPDVIVTALVPVGDAPPGIGPAVATARAGPIE